MKGQSLVGFILVCLLIAAGILIVIWLASNLIFNDGHNPCWIADSFTCKNSRVEECLKTEQYTKDQCVILIGGGK